MTLVLTKSSMPYFGEWGRGDMGFDSWVRKIPRKRTWQPTPVFFPEKNPMDRGAWRLQSMGVTKSRIWLSN